nr:hypothetical protein GCM10020063_009300 [Dactylosporangium thailandense]
MRILLSLTRSDGYTPHGTFRAGLILASTNIESDEDDVAAELWNAVRAATFVDTSVIEVDPEVTPSDLIAMILPGPWGPADLSSGRQCVHDCHAS